MEQFPIDQIVIGDRVRKAHPEDVAVIAKSIKSEGQLQPIVLYRQPDGSARLVAGLHRMEAFKLLSKPTIGCTWLQVDADDLELAELCAGIAECDENLSRKDLDEGMRALFVKRRAVLTAERAVLTGSRAVFAEARAIESAKADARTREEKDEVRRREKVNQKQRVRLADKVSAAGDTLSAVLPRGVVDEVAKEIGLSRTTVQSDLTLVRNFGAEVLEIAGRIQLGSDKASSKAEMSALLRVKKEYPDDYERVIASWRAVVNGTKRAIPIRPSAALRELLAKQAASDKADKGVLADLEDLGKLHSEAKAGVTELRQQMAAIKTINWKSLLSELRTIETKLGSVGQFISEVKRIEKLKVDGIR